MIQRLHFASGQDFEMEIHMGFQKSLYTVFTCAHAHGFAPTLGLLCIHLIFGHHRKNTWAESNQCCAPF